MTDTQGGRKENIVRPHHYPVYSFGAILVALFVTALCIYFHFAFVMSPIQRYYVPCYFETGLLSTVRQSSDYQLVTVADRERHARPVTESDVQPGSTPQPNGKPIPLALSQAARTSGLVFLYRGAKVNYKNRPLHDYLKRFVYDGDSFLAIFSVPLGSGLTAFLFQLPFAARKDVRRLKEMKYGRLLKGPVLVSPKAFNRAINGDGVGFRTTKSKDLMRIPQRAEGQHIELMGDTGTGKTRLIMQLLVQIRERGHSAIVYDPACEFVQRFYDPKNDTILNPLDARCPYWGPSEELRRRAEAKAIAASLYQPTTDKKGEFFTETPQKIFAHLLTFGPSPQELVEWMANPDEIDRRVQNTEMAMMIAKGAQKQRNGVLASLGLIADSLRMLPTKEIAPSRWSARSGRKNGKGGSSLHPNRASAKHYARCIVYGSTCSCCVS